MLMKSKKYKVLIAEDDAMMLRTIEFKLSQENFEVISCANGKEALQKISSENPDIIVTDVMMPYISGLDLIGKIKVEMKLTIPIIILSAVGLEKTVLEAFELGADDFITKPFSPNELIVRIKRQLIHR